MNVAMLSPIKFIDTEKRLQKLPHGNLFIIQNDTPAGLVPLKRSLVMQLPFRQPPIEPEMVRTPEATLPWRQLASNAKKFNAIIVNVDSEGSEHTLAFLAHCDVPAEKAKFIHGFHSTEAKRKLFKRYGYDQSTIVSVHHGVSVMKEHATTFIATGKLNIR